MTMTHATEAEIVRAADGSLEPEARAVLDAHLASCAACRDAVGAQAAARRVLMARPIEPVRDLSAAIRATLEAERPWIERLNWRRLSLRVAPIAAALTLAALFLVRTADTSAPAQAATATGHSVASALWSGEVTDDQLLTLVLSARPDDALSTYVQEK
jgi:anti-sigma factor RsiW